MHIERVGDFTLGWGESLVWDDRAERLYFVDCAAQTLHWLDNDSLELQTLRLPSMAAGIVPTEDGTLVACLDEASTASFPTTERRHCSPGIPRGSVGAPTTPAPTSRAT